MIKIIVSACLLGENVRYNGVTRSCNDPILLEWIKQERVVAFCPETSGGLIVPRQPIELVNGDGYDVLNGNARCLSLDGQDFTDAFICGAKHALDLIRDHNVGIAVIKDGSPSCGNSYIYDGSFSGKKIKGKGVFAALLLKSGLTVYNEKETQQAASCLNKLQQENEVVSKGFEN